MAYKSKGGCTPITAKIQKTTKGGITQPLLNVGGPVKMKASVPAPAKNASNRQKANESRQKSRAASDLQKAEVVKAAKLKKQQEFASKEFITNKRGRKIKNPKYTGATNPTTSTVESAEKKTGKGTYAYAKKNNTNLDSVISKRNKATKGSAEYNRYQNQINKAYGKGPTNRDTTVKSSSTITPKVTIESKKPTADVTITVKPKAKVAPKSKTEVRKTAKVNKKLSQAAEARAAGNEKKALRKEKAAQRKASRLAKKKK